MAFDFDGIDDVVNHGALSGMSTAFDQFSVAMWINPQTLANLEPLWSKWGSNVGVLLQMSGAGGAYRVAFDNWTPLVTTSTLLSTGAWSHIVVTYDGDNATSTNRVAIFHDGVKQNPTVAGAIPASAATTTDEFQVADMGPLGVDFADIQAAGLMVWAGSSSAWLSDAEASQQFHSYRPVRTTNLVVWSPYNEMSALAHDYSGGGNHGTVTGATRVDGPPQSGGHTSIMVP